MTDFTGGAWRSLIDGQEVGAIPDTSIARDPDTDSFGASSSNKLGIRIRTSQEWREFDAKISSNTSNATEAIIRTTEPTPTVMDTVDISGFSAGDIFTFDNSDLNIDTEYDLLLTASSTWTSGFVLNPTPPFTSADGNLEIINGVNDSGTIDSNDMHGIVEVGNLR